MAITITRSNGKLFATVSDGTTNTTEAPIKLVGIGAKGSVESFANNFFHLLENFASESAPCNPQTGMLWYNPLPTQAEPDLKVWTGQKWLPLAFRKTVDPLRVAPAASKWETPRTLSVFGGATGSVAFDGSSDMTLNLAIGRADRATLADTSDRWTTARALNLSGDVVGMGTIDGTRDIAVTTQVASAVSPDANSLVRRDGSGGIAATQFNGTAVRARVLENGRIISLVGDVSGAVFFDGSNNVSLLTSINSLAPTGVVPGTYRNATVTVGQDGRVQSITSGKTPPDINVNTRQFRHADVKNVTANGGSPGRIAEVVVPIATWVVETGAAAVAIEAKQHGFYQDGNTHAFGRVEVFINGVQVAWNDNFDPHPARVFFMGPVPGGRIEFRWSGIVRSTSSSTYGFGLSEASVMEIFNP